MKIVKTNKQNNDTMKNMQMGIVKLGNWKNGRM